MHFNYFFLHQEVLKIFSLEGKVFCKYILIFNLPYRLISWYSVQIFNLIFISIFMSKASTFFFKNPIHFTCHLLKFIFSLSKS